MSTPAAVGSRSAGVVNAVTARAMLPAVALTLASMGAVKVSFSTYRGRDVLVVVSFVHALRFKTQMWPCIDDGILFADSDVFCFARASFVSHDTCQSSLVLVCGCRFSANPAFFYRRLTLLICVLAVSHEETPASTAAYVSMP